MSEMKQYIVKTDENRSKVIGALQRRDLPCVVTIGPEKLRSPAQNSRYWASLTHYLNDIRGIIERLSDETGHTVFEMQAFIARELSPEHAAIVYAITPEAAHRVIKLVCGVPTSTRMGTKEFMKFEGVMEATVAEVAGEVNQVASKFGI